MHPFQGPTTGASFQRPNACPPQAFLEELARFSGSLIGTSPLPSIRAVTSIPEPLTTLWFITPPGNPSPASCRVDVGVQMAKNSVAAYGVGEAGLAQRGSFQNPLEFASLQKWIVPSNCRSRCAGRSRHGVEKRPLSPEPPCLHVATGLLHLFAETFDHFRLSAWF